MGDNLNTFEGTTTFGIHAGAGMNVDITQHAFIGARRSLRLGRAVVR